jgi:hypothetical protein
MTTFTRERGERLTLILKAKDGDGAPIDLRGTIQSPPQELRIEGDLGLAPTPAVVQLQEDNEGRPQWYADDNEWAVYWDGFRWVLEYVDLGVAVYEWRGETGGAGDVATPDLVPVWTAQAGATGTPTVTAVGNAPYTVDAWIKSATTGRVRESMNPVINDEGNLLISYDTVNLKPGTYYFDVRFTQGGADQITTEFTLRVNGTVTPPSPR